MLSTLWQKRCFHGGHVRFAENQKGFFCNSLILKISTLTILDTMGVTARKSWIIRFEQCPTFPGQLKFRLLLYPQGHFLRGRIGAKRTLRTKGSEGRSFLKVLNLFAKREGIKLTPLLWCSSINLAFWSFLT